MRSRLLGSVLVLVLIAAACGGGIESVTDTPAPGETETSVPGTTDTTELSPTTELSDEAPGGSGGSDTQAPEGSYFGGTLVQGYLQGVWCDSQGLTWVFSSGDVQVGADPDALGVASPIENTFSEPGASFVSRTDNQFTIEQLGQRIVFDRGDCGGSTAAELPTAAVLCPVFGDNKVELATMAGFKADATDLVAEDAEYGASSCRISGRPADGEIIDIILFPSTGITIAMAASEYDVVVEVPGLGGSAVYLPTENAILDGFSAVLFSMGDAIVRVEAGIVWESIPQEDLIQIARRIEELLMSIGV